MSTKSMRDSGLRPHPAKGGHAERPPHAARVALAKLRPHAAKVAPVRLPPRTALSAPSRLAAIQRMDSAATPASFAQAIIDRKESVLNERTEGRRVLVISDSTLSAEALALKIKNAKALTSTLYPGQKTVKFSYEPWDWTKERPSALASSGYELIIARSMTCACDIDDHFSTNDPSKVVRFNDEVHAKLTCGGATPLNGLQLLETVYDLLSSAGEAYLTNSSLESNTGLPGRYYSYEMWAPIVREFNKQLQKDAATLIDTSPEEARHPGFLGIRIEKR